MLITWCNEYFRHTRLSVLIQLMSPVCLPAFSQCGPGTFKSPCRARGLFLLGEAVLGQSL